MPDIGTISARLRDALQAVEEAKIPAVLREVAFGKAFDALAGGGAGQTGGGGGGQGPAAAVDDGTVLGKIAARLKIDADQVGYLFEEDDGKLHFVGRRFLSSSKREAQPEAMLLLAAGRQAAGLDEFTLVSLGRDLAADLGIIDRNTWMPGIKAFGDLVRTRGDGKELSVKLTQTGWESVRGRVHAALKPEAS